MFGPHITNNPKKKGLSATYAKNMTPLEVRQLMEFHSLEWIKGIMEDLETKDWYPGEIPIIYLCS